MIVEPAPAKINLALHVRRRRTDGYHEIETLFAFLRDGDVVRARDADAPGFTVIGPFADGLASGDNLVVRARDAFAAKVHAIPPLAIELNKRLPVASGIGGGSADAGAMLRILARMTDTPLDDPRLVNCAETLGADVPACLIGRSAIGRGKGEELEILDGLTGTPVLMVNPGIPVSTAAVFAAWDGVDRGPLGEGALLDRALAGRNDLQRAAEVIAPAIASVLEMLVNSPGVWLARMSGSGATCFALFENDAARAGAATVIRASHPSYWCLESALA
jgi:4-diphosphocytidyl-2-C-methyl-D-erythritol kinase